MINKVILVGNLGQDVDLKYTQGGEPVATLSVATSRSWKDKDGQKQDETEWHRVIVWGSSAKFCGDYLSKGSKVYIEGRLKTRKWQNKDGAEQYTTEVIASTVQTLTPRANDSAGRNEPPKENFEHPSSTGDQVPF